MFTATLKRGAAWKQPVISERHGYMRMGSAVRYQSERSQTAEKVLAAYQKSLQAQGYLVTVNTTDTEYQITGKK